MFSLPTHIGKHTDTVLSAAAVLIVYVLVCAHVFEHNFSTNFGRRAASWIAAQVFVLSVLTDGVYIRIRAQMSPLRIGLASFAVAAATQTHTHVSTIKKTCARDDDDADDDDDDDDVRQFKHL